MEYPTTREEAKRVGAKYYFTGVPCAHGHTALRKTKGACVECLKKEWARASVERAEYFKEYNKLEKTKDRKNEWYLNNKEKVVAAANAQPRHIKNEYNRTWKANNRDAVRASTRNRRRKHRDATPKWLTRAEKSTMRQIYQIAITSSKLTQQPYVVDHVVPLRGKDVCGLHVPWNLQVMSQEDNLKKGGTVPNIPCCKKHT